MIVDHNSHDASPDACPGDQSASLGVNRSHIRGITVRKLLICALALGGFAASAQAADLDVGSLKDPLPDSLTYRGVTIYGAIDVGYAYQTHGAPLSGALGTGLQDNMFGSSSSNKSISALAPNGLTQSFIGAKMEEAIGMGWTVVGKAEIGFVPTSGELADGCASLSRQNGLTVFQQSASKGDSSRCGETFNGPVYLGVSNAAYGTLTVGRQNTLALDLMAAYDPMALSYAFALIGYSGGLGGGANDTEDARWNNSVKYVYQYGPVHVSGMYADGAADTAIRSGAGALGAGATWRGFSADVVYTKENAAVSSTSLSGAQCAAIGLTQPACASAKLLSSTISDNSAWTVGGKYVFDLGGGWKDEPGAKFSVFAGYQHVDVNNPTDPVNAGSTTLGGYVIGAVNNKNFETTKVLETFWAGAKYELPSGWSFTGAYYLGQQNSWINAGGACVRGNGNTTAGSNCSGNINMGSFLVDYAFNKHFDVYAGVNYSVVDGGFAAGFLQTDSTFFMTGARLRF
jgi:predicted porin